MFCTLNPIDDCFTCMSSFRSRTLKISHFQANGAVSTLQNFHTFPGYMLLSVIPNCPFTCMNSLRSRTLKNVCLIAKLAHFALFCQVKHVAPCDPKLSLCFTCIMLSDPEQWRSVTFRQKVLWLHCKTPTLCLSQVIHCSRSSQIVPLLYLIKSFRSRTLKSGHYHSKWYNSLSLPSCSQWSQTVSLKCSKAHSINPCCLCEKLMQKTYKLLWLVAVFKAGLILCSR